MNMKNEQIPCLLQGNGFLFLPRAYDTSFKLIASSQQWVKLPVFMKKKPYYENKFKKKKLAAVSSMWKLMRMTQMDVIRFPRCRELGLIGISLHVNMRTRHRNYRTIL